MKSFLAIASVIIAVSIACVSRSAGSQSPAVNNTATQSTPTVTPEAQKKLPCTLTLAAAPTVNGIKLGLTGDELLALFPGSKDDAEVRASVNGVSPFGNATVTIRPDRYQSKEKFTGISQIVVRLLDGRVYEFTVGYNGPEYSHVDKFVEKVVTETGLPPVEDWKGYVGLDNQLKILSCAEFEVRVFAGGAGGNLNYVLVQDLDADKKLKERRKKARSQPSPTPASR